MTFRRNILLHSSWWKCRVSANMRIFRSTVGNLRRFDNLRDCFVRCSLLFGFLIELHFDIEDGGNTFVRNTGDCYRITWRYFRNDNTLLTG
jgi:hypothetical protein